MIPYYEIQPAWSIYCDSRLNDQCFLTPFNRYILRMLNISTTKNAVF